MTSGSWCGTCSTRPVGGALRHGSRGAAWSTRSAYQARTGCQWRYLPTPFGAWGAIWQQFRRWRDSGVWAQALVRLRRVVRTRAGRDPEPSLVMLDCQTVKGGRGGPGFHEAGGKYGGTFGAKRTLLIDYLGLPVAARVDSARPHDSTTGRMLLDDTLPRVTEVLADLGFEPLVKGVARRHKVTVTIKGWRKPNKPKGFKPIQPLWKVEDCFAQVGRWRRLARSYEATTRLGHDLAAHRLRRLLAHPPLMRRRPGHGPSPRGPRR
jgi:putative transposase